jgi:hypothetical protein
MFNKSTAKDKQMASITILNGTYGKKEVRNVTFPLIKQMAYLPDGQGYVTVDGTGVAGFPERSLRIKVDSIKDYELTGADTPTGAVAKPKVEETDEQVMERIRERFSILDEMTQASVDGVVRAMIVSGPPGVGKSYGVERILEQNALFDKISGKRARFEVVKGAMSAIGLYCKLFSFADAGNVLVFDDCDSILLDDLSLNILKAALDSGSKRKISWNTDSSMLRREGVPDSFDFKGTVIFITNIKFEHVRSQKLKDHLDALESRCHYLDLTLDTARDKLLRIKQIVNDGMLDKYDFTDEEKNRVIDWVWEKKDQLRELSLRTVLKVADLAKMKPMGWERLAETTVIKRPA